MKRVTTIGTCRIHHPATILAKLNPDQFILDNRRTYGYTHSSKEAVQSALFMRGDLHVKSSVWPWLSEAVYVDSVERDLPISDVYIVEISSMKELVFEGFHVQLNVFNKNISSAQVKRLVYQFPRRADLRDRKSALEGFDDFHRLDAFAKELLLNVTINISTTDSILNDLKFLKDLLGDILVVTHCNAKSAHGVVLSDRAQCVSVVENAAKSLQLKILNPSQSLVEFGQHLAMPTFGLDTAHYTPAFQLRLAKRIYADLIGIKFPNAPDQGNQDSFGTTPSSNLYNFREFFVEFHGAIHCNDYERVTNLLNFLSMFASVNKSVKREFMRILKLEKVQENQALLKKLYIICNSDAPETITQTMSLIIDDEIAKFLVRGCCKVSPGRSRIIIRKLIDHGFIPEAVECVLKIRETDVESFILMKNRVLYAAIDAALQSLKSHKIGLAVEMFSYAVKIESNNTKLVKTLEKFDKMIIEFVEQLHECECDVRSLIDLFPDNLMLRLVQSVWLSASKDLPVAVEPILEFVRCNPSKAPLIVRVARHALINEHSKIAALLAFSLIYLPEWQAEGRKLLLEGFRGANDKLRKSDLSSKEDAVRLASNVLFYEPGDKFALSKLKSALMKIGDYEGALKISQKMVMMYDIPVEA